MRTPYGMLFALLLVISPVSAQQVPSDTAQYPQGTVVAATPAPAVVVSTTAPISSTTTVSLGTYAGEVLTWLAAAFTIPIGALVTVWLTRLFKTAGLVMTQQMSDELNKVLVNGLNDAATNGARLAEGKVALQIKDPIVASAIQYTLDRMPDTLKGLGLDPANGETVKVLRARIATLTADPTVPTPTTLGPTSLRKS